MRGHGFVALTLAHNGEVVYLNTAGIASVVGAKEGSGSMVSMFGDGEEWWTVLEAPSEVLARIARALQEGGGK